MLMIRKPSLARAALLLLFAGCSCTYAQDDPDRVVVATESFVITEQDFFHYLTEREISPESYDRVLSKPGAVRTIFENLIVIRHFAAQAESNPTIDLEEVDWLVNSHRERLLMNRQLEQQIESRAQDMDWEAAAMEYYLANRGEFVTSEQVNVEHILIRSEDRTVEELRQLVEELERELDNGADFHEMVQKYSEDEGSKARNGGLGFFGRGQMVAAFEEAAFALTEPYQISDPVESQFGFHVIRFLERREPAQQPFEQVKTEVIRVVKNRGMAKIREDMVNAVKLGGIDIGLEVDSELLNSIEQRYMDNEQVGADIFSQDSLVEQ